MERRAASAESIFHAARMLADLGERRAYLDEACAADAALRAEVEAQLRADADAGGFLRTSDRTTAASPAPVAESEGQMVGRYKLLQPIGEGGFGSVWMAEQREPVKRRVALKIIKLGMDTKQVIARFEAERQALALMDHPNIARVLDAGATDAGRPFFVMELVRGVPLNEYADTEKLDTRQRLALFISVCQAIQHAHHKGVIHRDIKPSNVLVTLHDGVPVPKVIDFGIAKATNIELTEKTLFTQHRQLVGTPAYMSPEQAEMSGLDIDTRSDVYSLGVLLYELLTGTTPFDTRELVSKGLAEMMRIIREVEPPKPSTRLSTMLASATAAGPPRSAGCSRNELKGDLDWIVMRCLQKDRARRYETSSALALDVARHLRGEPITAAPPSTVYEIGKFVRRNRAGVLAGTTIAICLILGIVGTSWGMVRALREGDRASDEAGRATRRAAELERVAAFQSSMLTDLDVDAMAAHLRQGLLAEADASYRRMGLTPEESGARRSELERSIAGLNFSNPAAQSLDRNVVQRAISTVNADFHDQPLLRATLLYTLSGTLRALGRYESAIQPARDAAAIRRNELGEEHADTLVANRNVADLCWAMGRAEEADELTLSTLSVQRRTLGDEHPETLLTLILRCAVLRLQGRLEDAAPLSIEALVGSRRALGAEHPGTLRAIDNRCALLEAQGKLADALAEAQEALRIRRHTLGDDDPHTLRSISDVAEFHRQLGKASDALTLCREAMERRRRVLGDDHPHTLLSINNMGVLLRASGPLDEAERHAREAMDGRRRVLGDLHPDTLQSINNVAAVLRGRGRLPDAETYAFESLRGRQRALGPTHPDTLMSLNSVALLLHSQGRLDEAATLCRDALVARRDVLGADHPDTLASIKSLALILREQGQFEESAQLQREAIETTRRTNAGDEIELAGCLSDLGTTLVLVDALPAAIEAENALRECLEIRLRAAPSDWRTSNARSLLGHATLLIAVRDASLTPQERSGRLAGAETALLAGAEELLAHDVRRSPRWIPIRRREAVQRLIDLYDAWPKSAEAARWREKLAELDKPTPP